MQSPEDFEYSIEKCFERESDGCFTRDDPRKDAEKLIAARDAEIRRECEERAITWLKTLHHEPEPGLPWSEKIKRMQELQIRTLRAAITGEEE